MQPRISLVTLGVDDLERAVRFYRDGLGLETDGIVGTEIPNGAVAFFQLEGGLRLALWPRESIAQDSGLPKALASSANFTLAHNVRSETEVREVLEQARNAGARIAKPAHDTSWGGYAGYFLDPDDHLWEVAYNPAWLDD